MKRLWSLAVVLTLLAALLAACGSAKKEVSSSAAPAAAAPAPTAPATPPVAGQAIPNKSADAKAPAQGAPGAPAVSPIPGTTDRKIILNAQFDLRVKEADQVISKVSDTVRTAGGYVQETRVNGTKTQGRTVNMTLRVPSGQYGSIIDLIRSLGEVNVQREWTSDVTDQYVDVEARIKSQEVHLAQLQKLMDKSGSAKELMDIENEIARVTGELESLKGRLQLLQSQVAFSTITLNLYEPGTPMPVQPPKTVGERISRGFVNSLHGSINAVGNVVVWLISALPWLIFWGVILGVPAYFTLKWWRRKQGKQRPPASTPPPTGPAS